MQSSLLKKHQSLLPALILLFISISTAVQLFTEHMQPNGTVFHYGISVKHYLAFAALAVTLLSYFFFRKGYNYILAMTLALGLFGLINFNRDETLFSLQFNALRVTFQPIIFAVALVMLFIHREKVRKLFPKSSTSSANRSETPSASEVARFKEKYRSASLEELEKVSNDPRFNPATRHAAKELLMEKPNSADTN